MGPLSGFSIIALFLFLAGVSDDWWTTRPSVIAAVYIIVAILIFIDLVFVHSGGFWSGWWERRRHPLVVQNRPPQ
jgi:hypothetical protein